MSDESFDVDIGSEECVSCNRCGFSFAKVHVDEIRRANDSMTLPFWIDMESGVRTSDDAFSLDRAREVLERVAKINGRHAA